ncbi:uncharacterized protein LOC111903400 [Lactuca sativa]|uniref:uncharacterized protein LOC111903400 n=1 Tax=Lactuca sativa TaxID=4236 RepID=UPI000CD84374|nr:uncharacterized protein LOC111903400 [Lactuca sativa]
MTKRPKAPSPTTSEEEEQSNNEEEDQSNNEEEEQSNNEEEEVQIDVPTPPPSPKQTTIPISVAPIPPHVSSQPTTTTPLPPPIFSQATTTTTPGPSVSVNVSNTGAHIVGIETPVTTKPLSPSPSKDSEPTLGGENFDFDSTYYSRYQLPSEDEADAPVTRQHLQGLHEKLDKLIATPTTFSDVVLKAFLDTSL